MGFELVHRKSFSTPRTGKAGLVEAVPGSQHREPVHRAPELPGEALEGLRLEWGKGPLGTGKSDDTVIPFCTSKCFWLYHRMPTNLLV